MRFDRPEPMPGVTLELVLDGERIECDLYEMERSVEPIDFEYLRSDPNPIAIHLQETLFRIVARRRR